MLNQTLCILTVLSIGADWPTYEGDVARSGISTESLSPFLTETWRHESTPPRPAWPEPAQQDFWHNKYGLAPSITFDRVHPVVAAGESVYFGSTVEDTVTCLDGSTGEIRWVFYAEGPVRLAPSVRDDRVYFGSDDGYAYCVSAADGSLLWKHRVADEDRRIGGNGRMISAWPLRCGVLVDGDTVFCTAGIFPQYGVWLAALDAGDGSVRWRHRVENVAPQGYMLASPTRLYVPTGRTSPAVFDRSDGSAIDLSGINRRGGTFALIIDEGLVHRGAGEDQIELHAGSEDRVALFAGRQMIVDGNTAYLLGEQKLSALNRPQYLRLARERQTLTEAEKAAKDEKPENYEKIDDIRRQLVENAKAMEACWLWRIATEQHDAILLAEDTLFVGGQDEVAVHNTSDGSLLAMLPVDGTAACLAIAEGRLLVSTDRGVVHSFAPGGKDDVRPPKQSETIVRHAEFPARWIFHSAHIEGKVLRAAEGSPDGIVQGRVRLDTAPDCIVLDGTSSVELSDNIAALPLPKESLSVEALVAIDKPGEWGAVIGAVQDNGNFEKGWLLGNRNDRFTFALAGTDSADADGRLTYLISESRITPGRWVHLAATYDGSTMRLYVDGRLDATSTEQKGKILYPDRTWLDLGAYHDDNEHYRLRGRLREVGLLDRVLSESEIADRAKAVAALNTSAPAVAIAAGPHVRHLAPDSVEISWQSDDPRPMSVQMAGVGGEIRTIPAEREEHDGINRHRVVVTGLKSRAECSFCIAARDSSGVVAKTQRFTFDASCDVAARPAPHGDTEAETSDLIRGILGTSKNETGYALLFEDDGSLAMEISRQSKMQVIVADPDEAKANAVRARLTEAGIYGTRAVVHCVPLGHLPYASQSINLVVVDPVRCGVRWPDYAAEAGRVCKPCGGAVCGFDTEVLLEGGYSVSHLGLHGKMLFGIDWLLAFSGPLDQRGQWSHLYSDPSGKAASEEALRAPLQLQWFGRPGPKHMIDRHHRAMSPLVVDGRMFLPGDERLKGVDAYNGTILWDLSMPGFRRVAMMRDSGHLAARENEVFAAVRDGCRVIDAATGRWLRTLPLPESENGGPEYWGYLAVIGDAVLGTAEAAGASYDQHERAIPARVSYFDNVPVVTGKTLFSLDRNTGKPRWIYRNTQGSVLLHSTIVSANDRAFFVESRAPEAVADTDGRVTLEVACVSGASWLVALDLASGKKLWEQSVELPRIRNVLHAVCAEDTVILTGTHNEDRHPRYDLRAFNATDGSPRWTTHYLRTDKPANGDHGEQDQHPVVIGKTLYSRPWAFDVLTGKKLDFRLDRGGHGCGGLSGSACYLFGRGTNPRMYELDPGIQNGTTITQASRPGCWINMIAADGLLLIPEASSGCSCAFSIQASLGFAPVDRAEEPRE